MALARVHTTAADGTFSATGATAWNAAHGVTGATSGGIPYFDSATSEASSALLAQYGLVMGGGAGAAPATNAGLTFGGSAAGTGLAVAAGTATTDVNAILASQTWNAVGVTFTALEINATNTASATGSMVADFQIGGTNLVAIHKSGFVGPIRSAASGTFGFGSVGADTGYNIRTGMRNSGDSLLFSCNSSDKLYITNDLAWVNTAVVGWASSATVTDAKDTALSRISAGLFGVGTGAAGSFAGRSKLTSEIFAGVAIGSLNASPTTGEVQSVTDSLTPVIGTTVGAGGSAKALVWYNGANWTVIGV